MKAYSIIEAPSDLGLRRSGVARLPETLRAAGLLEGFEDVLHTERLPVPPSIPVRDVSTGVLNPQGIRSFTIALADQIADVLDLGRFPLVLGGDCSILLGPALALRRRGRFGLFFIDGHADYYSPETEPSGEVASMELAVVTGRDPALLADIEGLRPFVREEDVVVFGFRDADRAAEHGSPDVRKTAMHLFDLADVRRLGAAGAARQGIAVLEGGGRQGFWIHIDADVLNDDVMKAVDYRMPGGLWPEELTDALASLLASPFAMGMDLTIYNPEMDDEEKSAARVLVNIVNAAFDRVT